MQKTPGLFIALAIYKKMNGLSRGWEFSDDKIKSVIREMQLLTETMDNQVDTEEGLFEMACKYVLEKEAFEKYQHEEAAEYRSVRTMINGSICRKFSGEEWEIARFEASSSGELLKVEAWVTDLDEYLELNLAKFESGSSKLLLLVQSEIRQQLSAQSSDWDYEDAI